MYSVTQVALNDGYKCIEHDERQCMTGDVDSLSTARVLGLYDSCKHVADGHERTCRSYKVVTPANLKALPIP